MADQRQRRRRRLRLGGEGGGSRFLGRALGGRGTREGKHNRLEGTDNRVEGLGAQKSGERCHWPGVCEQREDRWQSGGLPHHSTRKARRPTGDDVPPR